MISAWAFVFLLFTIGLEFSMADLLRQMGAQFE